MSTTRLRPLTSIVTSSFGIINEYVYALEEVFDGFSELTETDSTAYESASKSSEKSTRAPPTAVEGALTVTTSSLTTLMEWVSSAADATTNVAPPTAIAAIEKEVIVIARILLLSIFMCFPPIYY